MATRATPAVAERQRFDAIAAYGAAYAQWAAALADLRRQQTILSAASDAD